MATHRHTPSYEKKSSCISCTTEIFVYLKCLLLVIQEPSRHNARNDQCTIQSRIITSPQHIDPKAEPKPVAPLALQTPNPRVRSAAASPNNHVTTNHLPPAIVTMSRRPPAPRLLAPTATGAKTLFFPPSAAPELALPAGRVRPSSATASP